MDAKNNKNREMGKQGNYIALNLKTVSIFHNDSQIIFIFKKTERLASAIYLLTSFMSDNEPIKSKMRESMTRLMSYSINLSNQGHLRRIEAMNNYTVASFEILSMLEVANISGIISAMNYGILKSEIEKNIEFVELKERSLSSHLLLSKNFFEIRDDYSTVDDQQSRAGVSATGRKDYKIQTEQTPINKRHEDIDSGVMLHKGQILIKDNNAVANRVAVSNKGHIASDKNVRYETIINLLKKTREITVKDVSSIISDCSEKTIQRELLNLVDKGVLKKEGERRWSKYSLAP